MRRFIFIIAVCACSCAYWACKSNSNAVGSVPNVSSPASAYYPLAVGDEWTYYGYSDTNGVMELNSAGNASESIISETQIDGLSVYALGITGYNGPLGYYAINSQNILLQILDTVSVNGMVESEPMTDFGNTIAGHTDTLFISGGIGSYATVETYMGMLSIQVKAGVFTVAWYHDSSGTGFGDYAISDKYYAQGVGLVKESDITFEPNYPNPGQTTTDGTYQELVSYSLH